MNRADVRSVAVDSRLLEVLRVYGLVSGKSIEEQIEIAVREYMEKHSPTIEKLERVSPMAANPADDRHE